MTTNTYGQHDKINKKFFSQFGAIWPKSKSNPKVPTDVQLGHENIVLWLLKYSNEFESLQVWFTNECQNGILLGRVKISLQQGLYKYDFIMLSHLKSQIEYGFVVDACLMLTTSNFHKVCISLTLSSFQMTFYASSYISIYSCSCQIIVDQSQVTKEFKEMGIKYHTKFGTENQVELSLEK